MKTATFTVRGTTEQAARWNRAAEAEGHRSAGTWLAAAADAYLKVRARAGLPLPLAWRRGRVSVQLDTGPLTFPGWISPPLAIFRGTAEGPRGRGGSSLYTLLHFPEGRIIATLRTWRQARALGAELAAVLIRGDPLPSPGAVVERHEREAK
jgi:hypothetical protein